MIAVRTCCFLTWDVSCDHGARQLRLCGIPYRLRQAVSGILVILAAFGLWDGKGDAPLSISGLTLGEIIMSYENRDIYGMYKHYDKQGPGPRLMGAGALIGEDVYNHKDEDLGDIEEIMLDMNSGKVAYAVLSFGGLLGVGEKLFAVPWSALKLDTENKRFILAVDKERLDIAPGFDKDNWPDMGDLNWQNTIHSFYGAKSYTDRTERPGKSAQQPQDTPDTPYEDTPYTTTQTADLNSGRVR
jgi:sporulation protein YlmC with PRC-barrel domain